MDELVDVEGFRKLKGQRKTYGKCTSLRNQDESEDEDEVVEVPANPVHLLEPRKELNDTIVDYYLSYIYTRSNTGIRKKVHIFNTFFYKRLETSFKKRNGEFSFDSDRILRWDKKVKIFDMNFLIVPVCRHRHWFLIIICYPSLVPTKPAEDNKPSVIEYINLSPSSRALGRIEEPCILMLDSLPTILQTKILIPLRRFLRARWRVENPGMACPKFLDEHLFKHKYTRVPRQTNAYDCGVYLLHSVERFIGDMYGSFAALRKGEDLSREWNIDTIEKRQIIKAAILEKNVNLD